MKINWKWPAKPGGNWLPGYIIVWRLVWAPVVWLGAGITFVGLAMSRGLEYAVDWWKLVI